MNILIVDDHEQNCHQLQMLLAGEGYAVVAAANGAEALEKARQSPPDLIVTDILMPVMDGFSLCRECKRDERLRHIPLVFYTATYTDEKDRELALNLGAARFIVKPEHPDAFLQMIEAVIGDRMHRDLVAPRQAIQDERVCLKEYSEALIRTLEDKMSQLEQTNRELERDLAEGKRAEEAVRKSEERYRSLFDNMAEGCAFCRMLFEDGRPQDFIYLAMNHAFEKLTGLRDVVGKKVSMVIPRIRETNPELFEIYGRVALTGQPERFETFLKVLDMWLSISVYSPAKEHFVTVFDVITERKRAEKDLLASHEQLRALAARIGQVREEESASLARELHDELGQGLTALQIDLACLDRQLRITGLFDLPGLRDKIAAMVPRAERLVEKTHTISCRMRPSVLDDLGLVAAVEWLAEDFEKRTGLDCVATLPAVDIALDLALAVALFRIVQEALTNVARHAKASRVEIRLQATEGEMVLEVEDNGCGITPQQVAKTRSLGLLSMRERAAAFGGTVDFRSEGGRGTTVNVRVPRA